MLADLDFQSIAVDITDSTLAAFDVDMHSLDTIGIIGTALGDIPGCCQHNILIAVSV